MKSDCKKKFKNYANIYSNSISPINVNTNETVPFTDLDTKDWRINNNDRSILKCKNPGLWQFTAQYQVVGILPQVGFTNVPFIDGWFILNKQPISNSDASASGALGVQTVLTIAITRYFKKGDILQVGIRSTSTTTPAVIGVQCISNSNIGTTNVNAPSLILTASKINQ